MEKTTDVSCFAILYARQLAVYLLFLYVRKCRHQAITWINADLV